MKDVEYGLGSKGVSDRLTKQMQGLFENEKVTEEQKKKVFLHLLISLLKSKVKKNTWINHFCI